MWLALGIVLLVIAVVALAFWLRTSYVTHGGGIGQVPVMGSAVQIPLLVLLGLWFVDRGNPEFDLPWWCYPLVGVVLALIIGWLIIKVGNIGENSRASDS